jgi:hypothetical protein
MGRMPCQKRSSRSRHRVPVARQRQGSLISTRLSGGAGLCCRCVAASDPMRGEGRVVRVGVRDADECGVRRW